MRKGRLKGRRQYKTARESTTLVAVGASKQTLPGFVDHAVQSSKNPGPGGLIQRFQFLGFVSELKTVAEHEKVGASLIRGIIIQYNAGLSRIGGMNALADSGAFTRIESIRTHDLRRHPSFRKGLIIGANIHNVSFVTKMTPFRNTEGGPQPEVWLRGPIPDVPALLQPVGHALLQARDEVEALMDDFPDELLWTRPGGVASAGFHLQHLVGILDRLFTYARGEALNASQLDYLKDEGKDTVSAPTSRDLVAAFHRQVEQSLNELRAMNEAILTQPRVVGRGRLPSTVLGLLFHAAEHTQRHVGQLLVTIKVQRNSC
jgi:uncharacterized damage-inducible protein DinB